MYAQGLEGDPPSVHTKGLLPCAAEKAANGTISCCIAAASWARGISSHGSAGWADVLANGCVLVAVPHVIDAATPRAPHAGGTHLKVALNAHEVEGVEPRLKRIYARLEDGRGHGRRDRTTERSTDAGNERRPEVRAVLVGCVELMRQEERVNGTPGLKKRA